MCTLTWWQDNSRYGLFFNRDEQKTRLPASPPELRTTGSGARFLTPVDGNRGGTWILANEHGLSIALLNYYDAAINSETLPAKSPSRGHLVLSLAASPDLDRLDAALANMPALDTYWPFHLFAIAPTESPRLWTWSGPGSALGIDVEPSPPITTSSLRTAQVCAARADRYRELTTTTPDPIEAHRAYHNSVIPDDPAASVRMRRPDAQTLSYSEILVDDNLVRFTYRPDTIDSLELNEDVTVTLPRHQK